LSRFFTKPISHLRRTDRIMGVKLIAALGQLVMFGRSEVAPADIDMYFTASDVNGDSHLSFIELSKAVPSAEQTLFRESFASADANNDGRLDKLETQVFGAAMDREQKMIEAFFRLADRNNDWKLSFEELSAAAEANEEHRLREAFDEADADHDSLLDLVEGPIFGAAMDREEEVSGVDPFQVALQYFDRDNDRKLSMAELADQVDEGERHMFFKFFQDADEDKDWRLDGVEAKSFSEAMDSQILHVDSIFSVFDENKDGKLTVDELSSEVSEKEKDVFLKAFQAADEDGDGQLDRDEAQALDDAMSAVSL